jgi:hypothetical protein
MNWNWFGWFGLLSLCLFVGFLAFPAVLPAPTTVIPYKLASISLVVAMSSSVVCPAVAGIRSSKWWLVSSAFGLLAISWFFWRIAA